MSSPFVHKFSTECFKYIYDVNTNNIVKVDDITFDIINDYGILNKHDIQKKWVNYPKTKIATAYQMITEAINEKNIFSVKRPERIQYPTDQNHSFIGKYRGLKTITLEVTQHCNMRCGYCPFTTGHSTKRTHSLSHMTIETAKKAIDYLSTRSDKDRMKMISFYGGEPLINIDLINECINYSRAIFSKNVAYGITTNGLLLSDNSIASIVRNNVGLTISLDGPKDIHNEYRKDIAGEGSHERVIENVKKLFDLGLSMNFNVTLVPPFELPVVREYFESLNNDNRFSLSTYIVASHNSPDIEKQKAVYAEKYKEYIDIFCDEYREDMINKGNASLFIKSLFEQRMRWIHKRGIFTALDKIMYPNSTCIPGADKLFVGSGGEYFICEKLSDFQSIGNVDDGIDIDKARHIFDYYCQMRNNLCLNCWALRLCKSCILSAVNGDQFDQEKLSQSCQRQRTALDRDLKGYVSIREKNEQAFDYMNMEIDANDLNAYHEKSIRK